MHLGEIVAYYDYKHATIRHVKCLLTEVDANKRCTYCNHYREKVLRSSLSRYLKQQTDSSIASKSDINSHVNYRFLNTPEKILRMHKLHDALRLSKRKVAELEGKLERIIQTDGIRLDDSTSQGLKSILSNHQSTSSSSDTFSSIFWQQQLKAASLSNKKGMRWHPAMIRWCLYQSSSCYSTLRNSGVITLPSDRTLRDYRHASSSTSGFSVETDQELLTAIQQQKPQHLAKYVGIILDEMHVKEGLFFDKHTGCLVGFSDLGETNNLLSDYEQQFYTQGRTPRALGKLMLVFMIRGLFTSLKFPYVQFVAASVKGEHIFPLIRQVIKHLTILGLRVMTITCDGASDNRKMFTMFNSDADLSYKTINVYSKDKDKVFFISDPPHLVKTIRNCFARGKLWVCLGFNYMCYDFFYNSVLIIVLTGI